MRSYSFPLDYWRFFHLIGASIAAMMIAVVIYLQLIEFVLPCLFCVYLRIIIIIYGLTSLLAVLYKPRAWGSYIYSGLLSGYSLAGVLISAYLVWGQTEPGNNMMSCGQGLGATMIDWPFGETLAILFSSYGSCTSIEWTFAGFSLALLALLAFTALLLFEIVKGKIIFRKK